MKELLACRVCLLTDVIKSLRFLLCINVQKADGRPQHLCDCCYTLIRKFEAFRARSQQAQKVLTAERRKVACLTTAQLKNIDRDSKRLSLPFTIHNNKDVIEVVYIENSTKTDDNTQSNHDDHTDRPIEETLPTETKLKDNEIKIESEPTFISELKCEGDTNDLNINDDCHLTNASFSDNDFEPLLTTINDYTSTRELSDDEDDLPLIVAKNEIKMKSRDIHKPVKRKGDKIRKVKKKYAKVKMQPELVKKKRINNKGEEFDFDEFLETNKVEYKKLSKQEQIDEVQARKLSVNYLGCMYKCDKCFKGFWREKTFNNHMAIHDPALGDYVCDICQARYINVIRLHSHIRSVHMEKYICKICSYVSSNKSSARQHYKWHSGVSFTCKKCGKVFTKVTTYRTHIRVFHPSEFVCDICGQSFVGDFGLKKHKQWTHRSVQKEPSNYCTNCEQVFIDELALHKHIKTASLHTKDGLNLSKHCHLCGDSFRTDVELKEHTRKHDNYKGDTVECSECQKVCKNRCTYIMHFRKEHLGVLNSNKLFKGSFRHKETNTFVCETCGNTFKSHHSFVSHKRIHTGEKPFQCQHCPKAFRDSLLLQAHTRTHTGEKPYKCHLCPKAFKNKTDINRHSRVHTGIKPYSCIHCGNAFTQSGSLKLHVNTVHLKLPAPYKRTRAKT